MSQRILIWTIVCFCCSISLVVALIAISSDLRQTHGSFLRVLPPHPVEEGEMLSIKYTSYYIAGGTDHTAYLGNYESPLHMIEVDIASLDTQHVSLKVKGIMDQKFWLARVTVDSPHFYVTDGALPRIYRGDVNTWHAERSPFDSVHFNDIVPMNPDSYAVKTLGNFPLENVIGKITTRKPHFKSNGRVLERQIDGRFCTNGMLHFDKERYTLVYLYYYRNEYMVLDTNLHLNYKGHTIDTISRAQIKAATILSAKQHVMVAPPLFVNKGSCVSNGWLFVNSGMLARNQPLNALEGSSVVDVYDLERNAYKFSFYIYNHQSSSRMKEFKVFGKRMIVLYDSFIRVYDLVPAFFSKENHQNTKPMD